MSWRLAQPQAGVHRVLRGFDALGLPSRLVYSATPGAGSLLLSNQSPALPQLEAQLFPHLGARSRGVICGRYPPHLDAATALERRDPDFQSPMEAVAAGDATWASLTSH